MQKHDVIKLIKELRASGKTYGQIAGELAKKGVVSKRTGRALTHGGVHFLLQADSQGAGGGRKRRRKVSQSPMRSAKRGSDRAMLEIVMRLLKNDKMDADDRIAACVLLVENQLK
jgi:hypothetical protein